MANDSTVPLNIYTDEGLKDPADVRDAGLDAINLYQAADLEENIGLDHFDAQEDAYDNLIYDHGTPDVSSSTSVADLPMPVSLSDIIVAQKTEDFLQTVFSMIGNAKPFVFEGEDGAQLSRRSSIPELEHIVFPKTQWPLPLHQAHQSMMGGHPGRTCMFSNLCITYYLPFVAPYISSTVR